MNILTLIELLAGLALLLGSADVVLRGSLRAAAIFRVSPLVVGLTIVALGTSAPEIAVAVVAGLRQASDIAVGNIVGSNIFNVLFILGISALISPIIVARQVVRIDVPILIAISVAVTLVALDGDLSTIDGVLLIAIAIGYSYLAFWLSRRDKVAMDAARQEDAELKPVDRSLRALGLAALLIILGVAGLTLGSEWTINAARQIAVSLGLSELFIGLTVVALGTSLPEVVTSILAALKNQQDIAVGNVIGSCIYNASGVLGIGAVTAGGLHVATHVLSFDIPLLIVTAVACLPIFFTGYRISRWEGGVLFFYYAAYIAFLSLDAIGFHELNVFRWAMIGFALPLTLITIGVIATRQLVTGKGHHRQ